MQLCRSCLEEKQYELFPRNTSYKSGRATVCKACQATKAVKYRSPLRTAIWKYKLTEEQAKTLISTTKCEICGGSQRPGKTMCIDHNHETGKVRGALCDWCNKGLGQFRDNITLLKKAAEYLDKRN